MILKDGETFAIAGLLDNRVIQAMNKMPGLGDIPILGHLFRSRSTRKSTDELLVVITPHFVRPLSPDEKAKLPEFPDTFLPTVSEEQAKKGHDKKVGRQEGGVCRSTWLPGTQVESGRGGEGERGETLSLALARTRRHGDAATRCLASAMPRAPAPGPRPPVPAAAAAAAAAPLPCNCS